MSTFASSINASKSLLAFYNANTAGNQVKKFADRKTAERRCALLAEELEAEGFTEDEIITAILAGTELIKQVESEDEEVSAPVVKQVAEFTPNEVYDSESDDQDIAPTEEFACPSCGATVDITSGRIVERAGMQHIVDEGYHTCHGCGNEWGTKDSVSAPSTGNKRGPVPAIAESMKLDRRTMCLETGEEWSNAGKIWTTHGTEWMTYAQHDKLTRTLYSAAKAGSPLTYVVNGRSFRLVAY